MQNRKYNGEEFVEMHGYDKYDYEARGYYSAMGRFTTVDPLAEKRPWESPYSYCGNNPINRIDPDGRSQYEPEYKEPLIDLHTGETTNVIQDWYYQKVDHEEQPKYFTTDATKSDKTTKNDNDNSKSLGATLVFAVFSHTNKNK